MANNKVLYNKYTFSDDDETLRDGSVYNITSLLGNELQADTIEIEVKCIDKVIVDFKKNAPLRYFRGTSQKGTYYVQDIQRIGGDTYSITAYSAMNLLSSASHSGDIYTGQTAEEVIRSICGDIPVMIESAFAAIKLYGWLPYVQPPQSSARDNLAQVLFAIGASLGTDLSGTLRVEKLWSGVASTISTDRIYLGGSVKYDSAVSSVSVTEHQYSAGEEEIELFDGTAEAGTLVTFSEPVHTLSANGFTILDSGANYAKLSSGVGKLTGKRYIHNTRQVTRTVTEGAAENVKSVTDATLVSLVNSVAVAKRLADYYQHRTTITESIVSMQEKPGQMVMVYDPYDEKMVQACIQSLDTNMSATLKSEMTALVGFTPSQPDASEYFDERVILTGAGEWEVPPEVTTVRAVLFSGAQGGMAGLKGGTSGGSKTHSFSHTSIYTGQVTSQGSIALWGGAGGTGGAGGSGGNGSKILDATLEVTGGTKISYACGTGGPGAAFKASGAVAAENGSPTQFGDITSENGTQSQTGWVDPTTGEVFGLPGETGISGGNGAGAVSGYSIPSNSRNLNEILRYQPSTGVTDEDGKFWPGAATREKQAGVAYWQEFDTAASGYYGAWAGYALGAGGAAGVTMGTASARGTNSYIQAQAASGQTGATPIAIPKKAKLTQGGRGGYGGGGGSCPSWAGVEKNPSETSQAQTAVAGSPGIGGNGGTGGEGGDGCIILFYRKPRPIPSGPLVTSDGKWLLDSLGRRIIV